MCINKVLLEHSHDYLCILYDCFCAPVAKLRSCNGSFYSLAFYRKCLPIAGARHGPKEKHGHFSMAAWETDLLLVDVSNPTHGIEDKKSLKSHG